MCNLHNVGYDAAMVSHPRWLSEDEQQFWRLIVAASRKVSRSIDDTLQEGFALSSSEYAVLVALSEAEGNAMRLRDLCAALEWDRSRASHQVTRMERRGLVEKRRSVADARGVLVSLSELGMERLQAAAPDHVESVRRAVFDHLSTEQIEAFTDVLSAVVDAPAADEVEAGTETAR